MSDIARFPVIARVQNDLSYYVEGALRGEQAKSTFQRKSFWLLLLCGLSWAAAGYALTHLGEMDAKGLLIIGISSVLGTAMFFSQRQLLEIEYRQKKLRSEPMELEFSSTRCLTTTPSVQHEWTWNSVNETVEFADGYLLQHNDNSTWVPSKAFSSWDELQRFFELQQSAVKNQRCIEALEKFVGATVHVPLVAQEKLYSIVESVAGVDECEVILANFATDVEYWVERELRFVSQNAQHRMHASALRLKIVFVLAVFGAIAILFTDRFPLLVRSLLTFVGLCVLYISGKRLMGYLDKAQLRRSYSQTTPGEWIYEFSPAGYRQFGTGHNFAAKWSSVLKVIEMRDGWLLFLTGNEYVWIPGVALETPHAAADLQTLFRANVPKYKVFRTLRLFETDA